MKREGDNQHYSKKKKGRRVNGPRGGKEAYPDKVRRGGGEATYYKT